jgi:hypothetical protein
LDLLSFLAKLIGTTARVGAAFALLAAVTYVCRKAGIDVFAALPDGLYQAIVVAGLLGAAIVLVEFVIQVGRGLRQIGKWIAKKNRTRRRHAVERQTAIKNMEVLTPEFALVLRYLKSNNVKRFCAKANNDLLYRMSRAFLLKIDDPNWSAYSVETFYAVPEYVWNVIDRHLAELPSPPNPPWIRLPDGTGWMAR